MQRSLAYTLKSYTRNRDSVRTEKKQCKNAKNSHTTERSFNKDRTLTYLLTATILYIFTIVQDHWNRKIIIGVCLRDLEQKNI